MNFNSETILQDFDLYFTRARVVILSYSHVAFQQKNNSKKDK